MLSDLVYLLIDPLFIFTVLLLLAILCYLRKKRSISKGLFVTGFVWFLIISTPWIPNLLIYSLESQYHPLTERELDKVQDPVDIIVLGGGHSNDPRLPANSRLTQQALKRLVEGIRIHRMIPQSRLVVSGSGSRHTMSQAENLAMAAELLGVNESDMALQNDPSDTWEESISYRRRVEKMKKNNEPFGTLIIVTSAAHMPRAVKMFDYQLSIDLLASPTDFRYKNDRTSEFRFRNLFPDVGNIEKMKYVMKEYAGLAEFYLLLR